MQTLFPSFAFLFCLSLCLASLARSYMVSHPEPLAMLGYRCKTDP